LETKAKLGTVDEILGPISSFFFSVKPAEGVDPSSFKVGQTFYMNPEDLLPMDRFTQKRAPGPKGGQKFQGKGKPQFHGKGTKPIFKGNNNKPFAKKPFAKNR
jgi:H/ACA ribonucleoprotein complex subunit 1